MWLLGKQIASFAENPEFNPKPFLQGGNYTTLVVGFLKFVHVFTVRSLRPIYPCVRSRKTRIPQDGESREQLSAFCP
jgi:hypothetical protein